MERMKTRKVLGGVMAVAVCCLLTVTMVAAQSAKTAKQAESLEKSGEAAKESVKDVLEDLSSMLQQYNSLVNGEAKKPPSAYKKLTGELKTTQKKIDGLDKQGKSLDKETGSYFKAWEKDLSSIGSDSLRSKSQTRLDNQKALYASISDVLGQAGEILAPVVQNLNDQIMYMGRDLSPDGLADLKDEAAELNSQAAEAKTQIEQLLEGAKAEAAAAPEADAEGDAGAEGEGEEGEQGE